MRVLALGLIVGIIAAVILYSLGASDSGAVAGAGVVAVLVGLIVRWKYIKGVPLGVKLGVHSGQLCMDIVNHLISNDYNLRLPDTAEILKESYSLCVVCIFKSNQKPETYGAMVVQAGSVLEDWLMKIFEASQPGINFSEPVKSIIVSLQPYSDDWTKELLENHSELIGEDINKWIAAAVSQFMIHVGELVENRYGHSPANFAQTLMTFAVQHAEKLR